jgi:hypothetical protein
MAGGSIASLLETVERREEALFGGFILELLRAEQKIIGIEVCRRHLLNRSISAIWSFGSLAGGRANALLSWRETCRNAAPSPPIHPHFSACFRVERRYRDGRIRRAGTDLEGRFPRRGRSAHNVTTIRLHYVPLRFPRFSVSLPNKNEDRACRKQVDSHRRFLTMQTMY